MPFLAVQAQVFSRKDRIAIYKLGAGLDVEIMSAYTSTLVLAFGTCYVYSRARRTASNMAYEVFKRTAVRVAEPSLSLVPDGRIALNAAAVRVLAEAGIKSVLLLWDKTNHKLALKAAAKSDKNSYAVSIVRDSHSGSLRAKSFLSHIGWSAPKRTMLPATWSEKEKMFEIVLPQEYVGSAMGTDGKRKAKTNQ